ncbi:putative ribonuclease H-like domain-containing protein [Tanacetum coccineum]
MYKVKISKKQETITNKAKSVLPSTGLKAASSVKRPSNKDSPFRNSILSNTKNSSKKVEVSVRTNKKTYVASKNVNVLIPCHDKCLANYKLSVHSKVRKALFTTPRTAKSMCKDTTPVVSKTKIAAVTTLSAKNKVVQIVLWIIDSGCSKHMTGDRSLLKNFIEKFMGTISFGNDHFVAITGYGDYVKGNITVCHVYYVEGLGHNLFTVGQFYDGDLEVAFCSNTCYVRNLEGDDLLTGARESNLYTISILDMAASLLVCLLSKATSTKSWLWHHRLSHLNFGTINDLTKHDLLDGLPKFKYTKDHLFMRPMRVATINGKKYILVIVDDYSRFTWVYFLHTKDETPKIVKKFIAQVQLNCNTKVHKIRTDNDTEFKNATLKAHYKKLGIMKQFSIARTPQQNGVVKRRNHILIEAARTMLIFLRLPEFLWAEAISTACFTQNRSIIHTRYNKTPYELLHGRKPNVEYFMCLVYCVINK